MWPRLAVFLQAYVSGKHVLSLTYVLSTIIFAWIAYSKFLSALYCFHWVVANRSTTKKLQSIYSMLRLYLIFFPKYNIFVIFTLFIYHYN
jgi:hypothetical protein